jgi:hypothetical protein
MTPNGFGCVPWKAQTTPSGVAFEGKQDVKSFPDKTVITRACRTLGAVNLQLMIAYSSYGS